ncbi:MAG: hypothetical protein AB7I44_18825 [Hyphomicrobiaceae bacterium]
MAITVQPWKTYNLSGLYDRSGLRRTSGNYDHVMEDPKGKGH